MNKQNLSRIFLKGILPVIIIALVSTMIWIHRETIRHGIYTEYGMEPFETEFQSGKACVVVPPHDNPSHK